MPDRHVWHEIRELAMYVYDKMYQKVFNVERRLVYYPHIQLSGAHCVYTTRTPWSISVLIMTQEITIRYCFA